MNDVQDTAALDSGNVSRISTRILAIEMQVAFDLTGVLLRLGVAPQLHFSPKKSLAINP